MILDFMKILAFVSAVCVLFLMVEYTNTKPPKAY